MTENDHIEHLIDRKKIIESLQKSRLYSVLKEMMSHRTRCLRHFIVSIMILVVRCQALSDKESVIKVDETSSADVLTDYGRSGILSGAGSVDGVMEDSERSTHAAQGGHTVPLVAGWRRQRVSKRQAPQSSLPKSAQQQQQQQQPPPPPQQPQPSPALQQQQQLQQQEEQQPQQQQQQQTEYCESETFRARCPASHVIKIDRAQYGRMKLGRCVEADLGYLGCSRDVRFLADRKCSGRMECEIRVPDGELDLTRPCFKELKVYLDIVYSCIRVTVGPEPRSEENDDDDDVMWRGAKGRSGAGGWNVNIPLESCNVTAHLTPSHLPSSLYPSHTPFSSSSLPSEGTSGRCGTVLRPWLVRVSPGQRINITLVDFNMMTSSQDISPSSSSSSSSGAAGHLPAGGVLVRKEDNFSTPSPADGTGRLCRPYGYFAEVGVPGGGKTSPWPGTNITICGGMRVVEGGGAVRGGGAEGKVVRGEDEREIFIYSSYTNALIIVFYPSPRNSRISPFGAEPPGPQQVPSSQPLHSTSSSGMLSSEENNFLLRYQSVGCADVRKLRDAWMERTESQLVIGCNSTRQTWHLHCSGQQWTGVIGNCTQHLLVAQKLARWAPSTSAISHDTLILLIVASSILVCLLIISAGLACLRSSWIKYPLTGPHDPHPNSHAYDNVKQYEEPLPCIQHHVSQYQRTLGRPQPITDLQTSVYQQKCLPAIPQGGFYPSSPYRGAHCGEQGGSYTAPGEINFTGSYRATRLEGDHQGDRLGHDQGLNHTNGPASIQGVKHENGLYSIQGLKQGNGPINDRGLDEHLDWTGMLTLSTQRQRQKIEAEEYSQERRTTFSRQERTTFCVPIRDNQKDALRGEIGEGGAREA